MAQIFTVTVSRGLETPLAKELRSFGLQRVVEEKGAVRFMGSLSDGMRACLWSRIGSRVLIRLDRFTANTADEIYEGVHTIQWEEHLSPRGSLWVDFVGRSKSIRHSQFGSRLVKDAVVDRLRKPSGERPSVEKHHPDLRIHVHLRNGVCTVSIDLCGQSLHNRSPGRRMTDAPLKETLAAGILHLADWPSRLKNNEPLIDPMCGSGTILIEAAGMAMDLAPGLNRNKWGFSRWRGNDTKVWAKLIKEANERHWEARENKIEIHGMDVNPEAIQCTKVNLAMMKLKGVNLKRQTLRQLKRPSGDSGLLICNPPYGERLEGAEDLPGLYRSIGDVLRQEMMGWDAYILTTLPHSKQVGLKARSRHVLFNGPLECRLLYFPISDKAPKHNIRRS